MSDHSGGSDSGDDENEIVAIKKLKLVHFGSQAEAVKILNRNENEKGTAAGSKVGVDFSNISTSNEYMELDEQTDATKEEMLAEFERRRKARALTLPTDDGDVKRMLRQLGEPICLFGEDKPERRERLRTLLSLLTEEEKLAFFGEQLPTVPKEDRRQYETTWYHEGSYALKNARIFMAKFSLSRAKARLENAKLLLDVPVQLRNVKVQETHKLMRRMAAHCSQIGDNRPISFCQFSPNSKLLSSASWSGLCKIWSIPDCKLLKTLRGHNSQVGCITFHPQSTVGLDPYVLNLASCSNDGVVKLWTLEDEEPLGEIEGHSPYRVSKLAFHPSGRFLATCCYDNSWRLFDLEENEEILYQEGHSQPVYDIAFQNDGAIALTGGLDSYARVWDLRTGRCIMFLEGHLKGVLAVAFSPNGHIMATGGQDNCCKIWDLRVRKCIYTIPAHQNLISRLRFEPVNGNCLISCSYDGSVKIWSHPGWFPLKTLKGHDSKIMCADISPDNSFIASSAFDRTFKLWAPEDVTVDI